MQCLLDHGKDVLYMLCLIIASMFYYRSQSLSNMPVSVDTTVPSPQQSFSSITKWLNQRQMNGLIFVTQLPIKYSIGSFFK